ncbi:MAG: TonB-dependent receptor domain-containing protein [Tsuneonella sp.]
MVKFQQILKASSASAVIGLALASQPAFAQDATEEEATTGGDVIIVTGSLIRNPNLEQATPVNVTTAEEISLQQSNVAEEILREIPGVVPSIGSAVNNGNGGASFVNLRGLGSNRNIVLLDGQRIVPAELNGRVDLNNIPLALVERVEVLTGGASATYGADAITGVVNFITNQDFSGVELAAGYQITERGDGATFRVDLTTGAQFDDGRGGVVLGVGYQQADPVYQGARDFSINNIGSFTGAGSGSGTAVPSRFSVPGAGTLQISPDGQSLVGTYAPFNFNPFNIFQTPFERFNIYANANYEIADSVEVYSRGLFSKQTVSTIIAPSGAFGIGVQVPLSNPFLPVGIRNQFCAANDSNPTLAGIQTLTAAECAAAAAATDPSDPNYREITTALFRRSVELGPRISEYQTTVFDYRAGLRGDITDSIGYDVSGSYGESENTQTILGYYLNSRVRDSLLATNTSSCLPGTAAGCVPVNFFTPTATQYSDDQLDFLSDPSNSTVRVSLVQARGALNGDVGFSSPLAEQPIAFAVGTEWRKYQASQAADSLAQSGDLGGAGGATPAINGGYSVWEAFGEVIAPLIEDRPFFQELTLNAGIRYSKYEIDAPNNPRYNTTTWTAGGSWAPVDSFRIRGNYARAVRAPNIAELFSPVNTGLTNLSDDPCAVFNDAGVRIRSNPTGELRAVCLAQGAGASIDAIAQPIAGQANGTGGGNLNLGPETADSYTIGAVFEPTFVPGLSLTVDYYNIKVKGAITSPTPGDVIAACFGANPLSPPAGASTSAACTSIRRDPLTGGLNGDPNTTPGLPVPLSNLGRLATSGIDVILNYTRELGFAKLGLNFTGNWTEKSTFQATPTSTNLDCVGLYSENCASIQPKYQWSTRATLGFDNIDVSFLWRHIDGMDYEFADDAFSGTLAPSAGPVAGRDVDFNSIKAYDYFDLTTRFNVSENLEFLVSVQNLFDKQPPILGSDIGSTSFNSGNTYPSTYDALGRRYAVSAKLRF